MNRTIVYSIVSIMIIGALVVGGTSFYGVSQWGGLAAPVVYTFDETQEPPAEWANITVRLETGNLRLTFVENASLLYRIRVQTSNQTVRAHGAPQVLYNSSKQTVALTYLTGNVNLTLGTGINYTITLITGAGSIDATLDKDPSLGNMTLQTTLGSVTFLMSDRVRLPQDAIFRLLAPTGDVTLTLAAPSSIGSDFQAAVTTGAADIKAFGSWAAITATHYQTAGYLAAPVHLTVSVTVGLGSINALLL